jgi:hypothetical protein
VKQGEFKITKNVILTKDLEDNGVKNELNTLLRKNVSRVNIEVSMSYSSLNFLAWYSRRKGTSW